MIVVGQMAKYKSYSEREYTPIDVNSLSQFVDMRELRRYAQGKGVQISELSQEEKEKFVFANPQKG